MSKYTEEFDWFDEQTHNHDDDEIILVSKSKIKRDAEALKDLGITLVNLAPTVLSQLSLDEDLLAAIELAKRIKKEGKRRQLQLIGKMLRSRDVAEVKIALDKLQNKHQQQTIYLQQVEMWREKLLASGDSAIAELISNYPDLDRQPLRTLVRAAQKERLQQKPPKYYRELFQYLKTLITD